MAMALLLSAMATGQAAGASIRKTSVRFVGRVPATLPTTAAGPDRTADSFRP